MSGLHQGGTQIAVGFQSPSRTVAPGTFVFARRFARPGGQMLVVGKTVHVSSNFGDDDLSRDLINPGNLIQSVQLGQLLNRHRSKRRQLDVRSALFVQRYPTRDHRLLVDIKTRTSLVHHLHDGFSCRAFVRSICCREPRLFGYLPCVLSTGGGISWRF
jgi:hypothetical protein